MKHVISDLQLTIEELDDVGEVHVVVQDDIAIVLHQSEGDKQHHLTGGTVLGRPDGLPYGKGVVIHQFCMYKTEK